MTIQFTINNYTTQLGENLYIIGSLPELGENNIYKAIPLKFIDNKWQIQVHFKSIKSGTYKYFSNLNQDTYLRKLPIMPQNTTEILEISDDWSPQRTDPWYSEIYDIIQPKTQFKTSILDNLNPAVEFEEQRVIIRCFAAYEAGTLEISGSGNQLLNWSTRFKMNQIAPRTFELELLFEPQEEPFAFKFLRDGTYEAGPNRCFSYRPGVQVLNCFYRYDCIPLLRVAGISLVRTQFPLQKVEKMVDFAHSAGFKTIAFPCIHAVDSSFALDHAVFGLDDASVRAEFDRIPLFERVESTIQRVQRSTSLCYWLPGYAVYRAVQGDPDLLGSFATDREREGFISRVFFTEKRFQSAYFVAFEQLLLHELLETAVRYAHANGIFLTGEFSFTIPRKSHNLWQFGRFYTQGSQGAVDLEARTSCNLNCPVLNWGSLKEANYVFLQHQISQLEQYFKHVVLATSEQFFRTWEIPAECFRTNGRLGRFSPANPIQISSIPVHNPQRLVLPNLAISHLVPAVISREQGQRLVSLDILTVKGDSYEFQMSEKAACKLLHDQPVLQESVQKINGNRCMAPDLAYPLLNCHPLIQNQLQCSETAFFKSLSQAEQDVLRGISGNYFWNQHCCWIARGHERLQWLQGIGQVLFSCRGRSEHQFEAEFLKQGILLSNQFQFQGSSARGWMSLTESNISFRDSLLEQKFRVDEYIKSISGERNSQNSTKDKIKILMTEMLNSDSMITLVHLDDIISLADGTPLAHDLCSDARLCGRVQRLLAGAGREYGRRGE
ncbi:4-alpha-glucanotransferase [Spironucleus salmonicida]|uniref:4-alpha-glucanotransferase n=1 Tax=Spironucleus salmonicida TaxID=348837 RepID=V6LF60_9EUKA|nr:4-alpha-glucanotransferase [Spironucleus salmonicida]|eukprot:EST42321.1 4-alpha-glucanotransferase [Spironucleus salmonicida]